MGTLLILLAAGTPAQEANQTPVFRAGISQVKVDVQVSERGRLISGLDRQDFIVRDEGVPQSIVYFGRESEPLSLLLLLDISGSMHPYLSQMAASARRALDSLQPDDRVAVMFFSRRTHLEQDFSSDRAETADRIRSATSPHDLGAGTAINEALLAAAAHMSEYAAQHPRQERRAILILTDNKGLNYQTPDDMVVKSLLNAGAVLNALVVAHAAKPKKETSGYRNPDFTPPNVFLIAEQTGGEAIRPEQVDKSFPEMLERIRTRYTLAYNAPDALPGSFRNIQVELTPDAARRYPKAEIRARTGYYSAPAKTSRLIVPNTRADSLTFAIRSSRMVCSKTANYVYHVGGAG